MDKRTSCVSSSPNVLPAPNSHHQPGHSGGHSETNPDCWTLYKTAGPICRGHEIHTGAGAGGRNTEKSTQTVESHWRSHAHWHSLYCFSTVKLEKSQNKSVKAALSDPLAETVLRAWQEVPPLGLGGRRGIKGQVGERANRPTVKQRPAAR